MPSQEARLVAAGIEALIEPPTFVAFGMRAHVRALVLLVVASQLAGCAQNMDALKETLGFKDPPPPPPPEPVYSPPEARAQVNATSVVVGVPLRFTSDGSRDPQGLALTFRWDFGDGATGDGASATHAYAVAGEKRVVLNVTNAKGLGDEEVLVVQVLPSNRPPLAVLALSEPDGGRLEKALAGEDVAFDASGSSDPEGAAVSFEWDFGDGATSHEASGQRAWREPGLYTVRLRVTDATGLSSTASRLLAVDARYEIAGAFELADDATQTHPITVAEGAQRLNVTLTFPAALGANDLTLVLKDADGAEVDRTTATTGAANRDDETRQIELAGEALAAHEPGAWTVEVVRTKGVQVEYSLVVVEEF